MCRRKILSSVHRPPFGTKTVEKALYTYTRGLVVVFVGLKKKCVHLFIKGVEIRSLKSPYEKIHSIKRTHDYDARTTVILTKLLSKKERESKKKSIIPSSSVFCDDQKNLSSSVVESAAANKNTRNDDDDDVTMIYTMMEPLCCRRK